MPNLVTPLEGFHSQGTAEDLVAIYYGLSRQEGGATCYYQRGSDLLLAELLHLKLSRNVTGLGPGGQQGRGGPKSAHRGAARKVVDQSQTPKGPQHLEAQAGPGVTDCIGIAGQCISTEGDECAGLSDCKRSQGSHKDAKQATKEEKKEAKRNPGQVQSQKANDPKRAKLFPGMETPSLAARSHNAALMGKAEEELQRRTASASATFYEQWEEAEATHASQKCASVVGFTKLSSREKRKLWATELKECGSTNA